MFSILTFNDDHPPPVLCDDNKISAWIDDSIDTCMINGEYTVDKTDDDETGLNKWRAIVNTCNQLKHGAHILKCISGDDFIKLIAGGKCVEVNTITNIGVVTTGHIIVPRYDGQGNLLCI